MSLLKSLKPGETFYTELPRNTVNTYSAKFGIKVRTESVVSLSDLSGNPICTKLIKITIL
jgi:hypothetical protein